MTANVSFRLNGLPVASAWWLASAIILSGCLLPTVAGLVQKQEPFDADQLGFCVGGSNRTSYVLVRRSTSEAGSPSLSDAKVCLGNYSAASLTRKITLRERQRPV